MKINHLCMALIGLLGSTLMSCGKDSNDPSETTSKSSSNTRTEVVEGVSSGRFSVSAGKKVQFAKGNLQYQPSTSTWRFATNQYDYVGKNNNGNVYEAGVKCNNSLVAADYTGWIDAFGWGTGNAPTKTTTDYNEYRTFVDWGNNKISNGGNKPNLWRTLTEAEWSYLLQTRTKADSLRGHATVNDVLGYILLPDDWTTPDGLSFKGSPNDPNSNWNANKYSIDEWNKMETAGAVFLPFDSDECDGRYWSYGLYSNIDYAYYFWFDAGAAYMRSIHCYTRISVRLVLRE